VGPRVARPRRPVALTGTPGTGKSAVAAALPRVRSVEVGDLAVAWGLARRRPASLEVDLAGLRRWARGAGAFGDAELVVGHLAHLLPLRDVLVLRCRPDRLERRLARAGRGSPADRRENAAAEATDVILLEAVRPGRRVWEVDTTDRPIAEVAREVARRLRRRGGSDYGRVDWLADPRVTAHLLDRER
jgi:adenylate kinase